MSVEQLFLREVHGDNGLIEIVHSAGNEFVSVQSGPFVLEIDLADLSSVISSMGFVLNTVGKSLPIRLKDGNYLNIALGQADSSHLWMSACDAHLRISVDVANGVLGALSEARRHIQPIGSASMFGRVGGASC
jgi:hypothetical protein